MKKQSKILWILLALVLALGIGLFVAHAAETDDSEISVEINKFNLSFKDNVYLKYGVLLNGVDAEALDGETFHVLFWTEPQTAYEKGGEDSVAVSTTYEEIDGQLHYIFSYKELAAKNMTDDIYARAYVEVNGEAYYSDVEKYSILRYAYAQSGKLEGVEPTADAKLQTLLTDMLTYGASAQNYFNYKTNRLANADFYELKLAGGALSDGTSYGLYSAGEGVILTAPETDENGLPFSHWQNSAGTSVSEDRIATVTMPANNDTYTAVYAEAATPDEYFVFTELSDGTYSVKANSEKELPAEIVIPATYNGKAVTQIANSAFKNLSVLNSVTIPDSVISIGSSSFEKCTNLTSVTVPNSVTSIGGDAFYRCTSLSSVIIGNGVASIGNRAFWGCTSLTSITVVKGNSVYHSDGNCLIMTAIDWLVLGCKTSIIPTDGSVTTIGNYAFEGCTGLTSITIPDSVTRIGISAFWGCSSLTDITIPDSVTQIDDSAFWGCSSLTDITIPDSVTQIGNSAFRGCSSLTDITIPVNVASIGDRAFDYCTGLTSITVSEDNSIYHSDGNCLIETTSKTLIFGCKNCVIPTDGSVTIIGNYAFDSCTGLTSITIPDSVTSIGSCAFCNCMDLTSITIPDSVVSIAPEAFAVCKSLTSITIPNKVTSIGDYTFYGCSGLASIIIPDSVSSIGQYAFDYCTGLTDVYYGGTEEEWLTVTLGSSNEPLTNATIYYYSEAMPTTEGNYWHYVDGVPTVWA